MKNPSFVGLCVVGYSVTMYDGEPKKRDECTTTQRVKLFTHDIIPKPNIHLTIMSGCLSSGNFDNNVAVLKTYSHIL